MKVTPLCASYILMRRSVELENLDLGSAEKLSALRSIVESVSIYIGPDIELAEFATVSYRVAKKLVPVERLYSEKLDAMASTAENRAREIVESISDKAFDDAVKILAAAAALAEGVHVLRTPFVGLEEPPTPVDAVSAARSIEGDLVSALKELGGRGGTLYYVFGRAVALPYDIALVSFIRDQVGLEVIGVIRGERFEDYASIKDLEDRGYLRELDDVIVFGGDEVAPYSEEAGHAAQALASADMVIVKGELLLLHFIDKELAPPLYGLAFIQCPVAAELLGARLGAAVVSRVSPRGPGLG